ncbi:hypothetical protein NL676_032937 [Syzygium grande]|nr:hypothetical protein NL676_032937 [Syzygium grande]
MPWHRRRGHRVASLAPGSPTPGRSKSRPSLSPHAILAAHISNQPHGAIPAVGGGVAPRGGGGRVAP